MLQIAHRLTALFAPQPLTPGQAEELASFLRILSDAGGTILDSDPLVESEAARLAERLGYASSGGGWSPGISLTRKGERALRPEPVVEPGRNVALSA